MAASAPTPSQERASTPFGAWLGIVLLFLFFGIFVLVLVAATPHGDTYEAKRARAREEKLKTARQDAAKELSSFAWVDKNKGVARIPIDRAMQLTLADLASKKPAPANPIETPGQSPSPSPAPQPAASPGASPGAPPAAAPPAAQPGATEPPAAPLPSPTPSGTPKPTAVQGINSENRNQPAATSNPPGALPGTQPGAVATPAAAPSPPSGQPAVPPSATPEQNPPGSPIPVPGKTP